MRLVGDTGRFPNFCLRVKDLFQHSNNYLQEGKRPARRRGADARFADEWLLVYVQDHIYISELIHCETAGICTAYIDGIGAGLIVAYAK